MSKTAYIVIDLWDDEIACVALTYGDAEKYISAILGIPPEQFIINHYGVDTYTSKQDNAKEFLIRSLPLIG